MTDDLRTRIARTTWISHRDRQLAQLGMKPSEYAADIPVPDWAYAIADAVMAELDLQPIRRTTRFPERRWVTPWELIDTPEMPDSATCSMGPSTEPCEHGTRRSR